MLIMSCVIAVILTVRDGSVSHVQIGVASHTEGAGTQSSYSQTGDERLPQRGREDRGNGVMLETAEDFLGRFNSIDQKLTGLALREERSRLIDLAARKLSLQDLAKLAQSVRNKVYHEELSGRLALRYSAENPMAGLRWLIAESRWDDASSASLTYALSRSFEFFPESDINEFISDKKKALFIEGVVKSASIDVSRNALEYLITHPEIAMQNGNLISSCFDPSLSKGDFKGALLLANVLPNGSSKNEVLTRIFETASSVDPNSAKLLLDGVHDGPERSVAVKSIADSWGRSEPDKVASWASGLKAPQDQDAAKEGLVDAIIHSDPSSALEWAQSIRDKGRRELVIAKLEERIRVSDPDLLK